MNGSHTYAIFNYEHDGLQWSGDKKAVIGFMAYDFVSTGFSFFYNHPLSQTAAVVNVASSLSASNTGIVGKLIYLLSAADLPNVLTFDPTNSLECKYGFNSKSFHKSSCILYSL